MRIILALMLAFATIASTGVGVNAQDAGQDKAAPKAAAKTAPKAAAPKAATMVLLCPQQKAGGDKVNVRCAPGEKCCYHPLFDNGSCVPQADGCLGIVNPLPLVPR